MITELTTEKVVETARFEAGLMRQEAARYLHVDPSGEGQPEADRAELFEVLANHLEMMTLNRDNLRIYLHDRTRERDDARDEIERQQVRVERSAKVLQAVIAIATRPPANVDAILRKPSESLAACEEAEVALWHEDARGNAIRLVAELATMTDIEAETLDGYGLREVARMLQVPDEHGERAATLTRFYSEEERERAIHAMLNRDCPVGGTVHYSAGTAVDAVAEALGMRRAAA